MGPNFVILNDSSDSFQCTFHERKKGKIERFIFYDRCRSNLLRKREEILRAKMHRCILQNLIRSTSTSYKGLLPDLSWRLFRRIEGVTSTTLASTVYYLKYDGDDISTQFSRMIEMEFRESQHLIHHSIIWPTQIIFDKLFFSLPEKIFSQEE